MISSVFFNGLIHLSKEKQDTVGERRLKKGYKGKKERLLTQLMGSFKHTANPHPSPFERSLKCTPLEL